MPEAVRTEVHGDKMVAATLAVAEHRLADMAPPEVGTYIRDQGRARAPYVSGALRASVQNRQAAGKVSVGSGLVYAPVIHNGWPGHHIRANPFLIPVAEETESTWGRAYEVEAARITSQVRGA